MISSKKIAQLVDFIEMSTLLIGWTETWNLIDEIKDARQRMILRKVYQKLLDEHRKKGKQV